MNTEKEVTTYDLEQLLAVAQFKHSLHGQQVAIEQSDHNEIRRYAKLLDNLVREYGVSALNKAKEEIL
ncbi:hypothetical protein PS900_02077 [Pseudomonas fluorescens]|uniref:Uncharacterized protein n=1 Tax=Pseudomonas fluorescens TaxID=294 RepID=A0A8H2NR07_PSEFL|nr:hypothetical protein [Pseudomonas fluorescens]VVO86116.1 hypothetical protein PS900_02077 [Pseudomonas fluorescens]